MIKFRSQTVITGFSPDLIPDTVIMYRLMNCLDFKAIYIYTVTFVFSGKTFDLVFVKPAVKQII
jgi:hypothetical protein